MAKYDADDSVPLIFPVFVTTLLCGSAFLLSFFLGVKLASPPDAPERPCILPPWHRVVPFVHLGPLARPPASQPVSQVNHPLVNEGASQSPCGP